MTVALLHVMRQALGIKMGTPAFKNESYLLVIACMFSLATSPFTEIFRRVMDVIKSEADELEIYSIDEAFLTFDGPASEERARALDLRYSNGQASPFP